MKLMQTEIMISLPERVGKRHFEKQIAFTVSGFYELLSMQCTKTLKEGQQSELPHHLKKQKIKNGSLFLQHIMKVSSNTPIKNSAANIQ